MAEPIMIENSNDYIKEELEKIWGKEDAEYFSNPTKLAASNSQLDSKSYSSVPKKQVQQAPGQRLSKKPESLLKTRKQATKNSQSQKQPKQPTTGLYAFEIWNSMREKHSNRSKLTDDLEHVNYYKKVKETMNQQRDKSEAGWYDSDQEVHKYSRVFDVSGIKSTRIFRNEIELMYRSSKMNQDRLRKNSNQLVSVPVAKDKNNHRRQPNGILDYLPIMFEESEISKEQTFLQIKEAASNQLQGKRQDRRQQQQQQNSQQMNSSSGNFQFLHDRPFKYYLATYNETDENNKNAQDLNNEQDKGEKESSSTIQSVDKPSNPPPLSLEALMEYKPNIKAPGQGAFENGKPKLFKMSEKN